MADNNLIQWPRAKFWDKAWNPVIGCRPCSPACEHCYAAAWAMGEKGMTINYVSLFSGIEAFSVAASRIMDAEWNPVFFSEIEPFPCAVLAHRFPGVPNLGDIRHITIDPENNTATNGRTTIPLPRTGIDILAGGSPCQDVSVAGCRAGMSEGSGTRSSLAFEYARLVEELRPRLLLWENVPGVLSSNGGRDFLAFQRSLVERGYSLAYRVLDAQYARVDGYPLAVPQRRRRVWLVGCLGTDVSVPAQILFERPGLLGDTPPRRAQGQGSASPSGYRSQEHDRVVGCAGGSGSDVSEVLTARSFKGIGARNGQISGPFAVVNVSVPSDCLTPGHPQTHRVYRADGAAYTLDAGERSGQDQRAVLVESASFDGEDVSATLHKPNGSPGYSDQEIFAQQGAYLARVLDMTHADEALREVDGGAAPTLQSRMGTGGNQVPLVAFTQNQREEVRDLGDASGTLPAEDGSHQRTIVAVPSVCKTLSAEGFYGMPDIQKGNGMPVVAVRTAQTGDNGRGISAKAAYTLDLASGQAVAIGFCPEESAKTRSVGAHDETSPTLTTSSIRAAAIGFKPGQSGREDTRGCGAQVEQSPTLPRDPGGMGVGVAIGFSHVASGVMLDSQPKPCATTLKRSPGGEGAVATIPAPGLSYIVRRLTPVECSRLQCFPDWWCRIPLPKWRGIDADEADYLASLGPWYAKHIRPASKSKAKHPYETDLAADSPIYKALGNSWATNCAEWILRRIVAAFRLGMIEEVPR